MFGASLENYIGSVNKYRRILYQKWALNNTRKVIYEVNNVLTLFKNIFPR